MIGMIVIAATGCWIPAGIAYHIKHVNPELNHWALEVHPWMMYLNSAINPFILLVLSEDFRSAYKQLYRLGRETSTSDIRPQQIRIEYEEPLQDFPVVS